MMACGLLAGMTCFGTVAADDSTAMELEKCWAVLGTKNPPAVEQAIADLAAHPARTISFLRERLRPVPSPDPRRVAAWLSALDSNQFAVRQKASEELAKLGEVVEPNLRKTLHASPSLEVLHRVETLLAKIKTERLNPSPERLRRVRAIEVLERIGDGEACRLLTILAHGAPLAQLTTEAKTALERLGKPASRGVSSATEESAASADSRKSTHDTYPAR